MDFIKVAEEAFASGIEMPSFKSGDTITVAYRIKEGNKERIQQYRGVVILLIRVGHHLPIIGGRNTQIVYFNAVFTFCSIDWRRKIGIL